MKNPRKEVNTVLKKEASYFGDIVILPFMDRYDLVVLKTMAICEFGVSELSQISCFSFTIYRYWGWVNCICPANIYQLPHNVQLLQLPLIFLLCPVL